MHMHKLESLLNMPESQAIIDDKVPKELENTNRELQKAEKENIAALFKLSKWQKPRK